MDTHINEIPIILNSENADVVTDNGSSFTVNLNESIRVPDDSDMCWVKLLNATIPNTNPNIITGTNDLLHFSWDNGGGPTAELITFPEGIYDIDSINDEITRQVTVIDSSLVGTFQFFGNEATQKAILVINTSGGKPAVTIDFVTDYDQSIGPLLGFEAVSYPFATNTKAEVSAPNTARINSTEFFLVHCDLVDQGIRFNNTYSQILGRIIIDDAAGSTIVHRPYNIPKIMAKRLIGNYKTNIHVWLTDQNNVLVNTSGENYTISVVINYI